VQAEVIELRIMFGEAGSSEAIAAWQDEESEAIEYKITSFPCN